MEKNDEVFKQDLSKTQRPGGIFTIQLLMKEQTEMPDKKHMTDVMQKHLQEVECFWYDEKGAGFAAKKYLAQFKDTSMPPQLMVTNCAPFDAAGIDDFQKSQMWDCNQYLDSIFNECHYHVFATDMLAAALPAKERAELDMDFMEALVELYPECVAVYFSSSGKMFLADQIRNHKIPREDRFIYFAVNARLFNIQDADSMVVDTLGMSTLFLPDIQYHFHDMNPNWVVNHGYNIASYIFKNDNPMKDGDTIDGMVDGELDQDVQWICHYEDSLIQPAREVLDVCMDEFASGNRECE